MLIMGCIASFKEEGDIKLSLYKSLLIMPSHADLFELIGGRIEFK